MKLWAGIFALALFTAISSGTMFHNMEQRITAKVAKKIFGDTVYTAIERTHKNMIITGDWQK